METILWLLSNLVVGGSVLALPIVLLVCVTDLAHGLIADRLERRREERQASAVAALAEANGWEYARAAPPSLVTSVEPEAARGVNHLSVTFGMERYDAFEFQVTKRRWGVCLVARVPLVDDSLPTPLGEWRADPERSRFVFHGRGRITAEIVRRFEQACALAESTAESHLVLR